MKQTKKILLLSFSLLLVFFTGSCEKDLIENETTSKASINGKSKPNLKVTTIKFDKNHPTLQKIKNKTKTKYKTYRTSGDIEHNVLEGYFGQVKLDNGVEIIDSLNRKTTTFEVKENSIERNVYFNFVVQNDTDYWLYKIEKLETQYKNFPVNSTLVSRYALNDNLTLQNPCDTIVFLPFGEYRPEDIINNNGGGGGSVTIGNLNDTGGNPNFGGFFGGFTGGYFNGAGSSGGSSSGSTSGNAGGDNGPNLALIQVGDWVTDAWEWIKDLFGGGCNCGNRNSNNSVEQDIVVRGSGVVIEIKDSPIDCGESGYVFIVQQDEYVDKIKGFEEYFSYLHNNDRVFLYFNPYIVDYLDALIQQHSSNQHLMSILPELISLNRLNKIDWNTTINLIEYLKVNPDNLGALLFVDELLDLAVLENNLEDANKILNLSIMFETSEDIFSDEFCESVLQYTNINPSHIPPGYPLANLSLNTFFKYKQLRQINPEWSRARCIYFATKDIIHISLDAFGMIPLYGEPADIINGALYLLHGENLNATLSFASAVPIAGWVATGTKYAIKINEVAVIATKVKLVWKVTASGLIEFGSRSQLRQVLGLLPGNPNQAHHIIPWGKQTHPAIQKAAKSGNAFHMNEALNGIPLSTAVHNGSHAHYDNLVQGYLDAIPLNSTPQQAYNEVLDLINNIRTAIINNPNTPINQLNF